MKKIWSYVYIVLLLIIMNTVSYAQDYSDAEIKTVFIYQFGLNINWENENKIDKFKIAVYGKDETIVPYLKNLAGIQTLKGKQIEVLRFNNIPELLKFKPQIIYVNEKRNYELKTIINSVKGKNILVISNKSQQQELVMINFIYSAEKTIDFEINKKKISEQNLKILPKLLLLGGTEIDVKELYKEQEIELEEEKEKVEILIKKLERQKNLISELNIEIEQKLIELKKQQNEIIIQYKKINDQKKTLITVQNDVKEQRTLLSLKTNELIKKQYKINIKEKIIKKQNKKVEEGIKILKKLTNEIEEKQKEITEKQKKIDIQSEELGVQAIKIDTQQNILIITGIVLIIIISLSVLLIKSNKTKQQINKELKTKNKEVRLRNAEILQKNKKIQAQATELERFNKTLEAGNIEILQKNEEIQIQSDELELINTELEKHRNQLEQLVRERTAELLTAKEKAEESDRLKSAFLANMSHEIRTPMNAIVGFSNLLNNKEFDKKKRKELISYITHSSDTLLHLINDIIDISKIEAGQLEIIKENCFINTTFDELINIYEEKHISDLNNKIEIKFIKKEDEDIILYTDSIRLQQILINLIDNALKFTENGFVEIGYSIKESVNKNEVIFYIKDTGIGLTKQQQNKIFSRFTKLENEREKLYRGAGLGLSICKNIVELLGGEIWLDSKLNKGSTFYFSIPYNKDIQSKKEKHTVAQVVKSSDLSEKTLLIAEDEISNFKLLKMFLSETNIKIIHAKNGNEAFEKYIKEKIDLILMDIKMPIADGLKTTKRIRIENPNIPIIAQTAFAMENDSKMCINAGCNDYITKPINKHKLLDLIYKYL
ncbi:MAG: YfiR/HmsC family protein [Bacteroidales bacterium]|nr:YfiR/HmsC family protein [Bacteroidales bacterium]